MFSREKYPFLIHALYFYSLSCTGDLGLVHRVQSQSIRCLRFARLIFIRDLPLLSVLYDSEQCFTPWSDILALVPPIVA